MDISDEVIREAREAWIEAAAEGLDPSDRMRAALLAAAPALIRKISAQDKALEDIAELDPTAMSLGDCIFAVTSARAAIRSRITKDTAP